MNLLNPSLSSHMKCTDGLFFAYKGGGDETFKISLTLTNDTNIGYGSVFHDVGTVDIRIRNCWLDSDYTPSLNLKVIRDGNAAFHTMAGDEIHLANFTYKIGDTFELYEDVSGGVLEL